MKDIMHNEWSRMKSFKSIQPRINDEIQNLITRKLKRATENLADDGKRKIKRSIGDSLADAEDVLMRHLPDFDSRDFVKSIQNKIQMDIESSDLFTFDSGSDEPDYGWGDIVWDFLNGASWGVLGLAGNFLTHDENVAKVENVINSISSDFDPKPYLDSAFASKETVIDFVKKTFITELIEPLQEQIQEIRTHKYDKEKELSEAKEKLIEIENSKIAIASQIAEINNLKEKI